MDKLLQERIDRFVQAANRCTEDYWTRNGYTHMAPPKHRANEISDKWVRVVMVEERNSVWQDTSVFCFICLKDYSTKALGQLKTGDIHKAATFKAPAKHARGNVFNDDCSKCLTPWGIVYLK